MNSNRRIQKKLFAEIKVEGATCVVKGTYKVKGTQTCKLPSGELFAVNHEIKCTSTGSKLKLGTEEASFEGIQTAKLESKKEWSGV